MKKLQRNAMVLALLCLSTSITAAQPERNDPLRSGFLAPPASAKPHTWWHWMNGNVTKVGITADLEAMKQIGLSGATIVNADLGSPQGSVDFLGSEWRDDLKFAAAEANRLGLQLSVENCAGWSSSGGPWITPANAMQRLTSAETRLQGPMMADLDLPKPETSHGYYRDIAVLAFKVAEADATAVAPSADHPAKDGLVITRAVYGAASGEGSVDVKARIESLINRGLSSVFVRNDELGGDPAFGVVKRLQIDFTLHGKADTLSIGENDTLVFPVNAAQLKKAHRTAKTDVEKTFVHPTSAGTASREVVPRDGIIDLSAHLSGNGHFTWEVPPGAWTILRLGYTPTGETNHPAMKSGVGLECDKFSQAALDAHWAACMQKVLDDCGPLAGKTVNASLIDSYEVGGQDWSANFREEFQKRRGYDPVKFLPSLTRRVIDSPAVTDRFLWDMRRTASDLFAENYFGHFTQLCHEHGITSEIEPYSGPFESMQCGASSDLVMGEFWGGTQGHSSVKLAASIAHTYGKTQVGAEAFTSSAAADSWQEDPYSLKALGDLMFCQGINLYVFHRYAMQPWPHRPPGMTLGEYGLHFERTQTWWNQGKAWIDYIARCQFLLQQGRPVADIAYFTGQGSPSETRIGHPAPPAGYDYDAVNADVLLHGASVKNGRLTLASGANYGVLILPPDDRNMTPELLTCIDALVRAGATVIGPRPDHSPSLADYPRCDVRISELARDLWDKGRIVPAGSLTDLLGKQNLPPDFEYPGNSGTRLAYVHRTTTDGDLYFISNQNRQFTSATCTFRVTGKVPELWHPDTGAIEPVAIWNEHDGRITLPIPFDPAGSVFVLFRPAAAAEHLVAASSSGVEPPPAAASKLEIQHAVYAAIDHSADEVDVTAKLRAAMQSNQLNLPVTNDSLVDHDPAPNHKKELRVDYVYDGKSAHLSLRENQTLMLPVISSLGRPPGWEITSDGSPILKFWADDQADLRTSTGRVLHAAAAHLPLPVVLNGPWKLTFPAGLGAPPSVNLDALVSWSDHSEAGVRYFSGTAAYTKQLEVTPDLLLPGHELWLDLGAVKNFAEVTLNGHPFATLWKPPFRVNVTPFAKAGLNTLEVKVTNLWPNRLIGDEQLPPDCELAGHNIKAWPRWLLDDQPSPTGRYTFTTYHHWKKDSSLLDSGLLGPVTLQSAELVRPQP